MTLDDFDFDLPPELIAQHPALERQSARLLDTSGAMLADRRISDFPDLIRRGDLLVFNDTRVIKARLFGKKDSGGRVEVLIERIVDPRRALAQIRASKSPKPGGRLVLENAFQVNVSGRMENAPGLFVLELDDGEASGTSEVSQDSGDFYALLEKYGRLPLPPYIAHPADADDEERYQTVYARYPGAVAAPTAGLHFDESLFARLKARSAGVAWLTLHIGAGTFQPVRVRRIDEHRMHSERFHIPQATADAIEATRARGGRVVAVGTTSLRALEAAGASGESGRVGAGGAETDIFITPGYQFRVIDALFTNFHLPKSTLIMLTHAFAGSELIRKAYAHAVAERYRFFSYGDAMFLERHDGFENHV
ncbi:MAG: tRNA preQ1(34) S-adenosylmethionine ribosyltransferase-isomerase QueA [Candidatus Accumulibacter sp.]|jgi:S-adenosylmethionine:tRNA ribosyltransferase-isomerase|nr:tRNA preQ1(34) S-adenosylmethionine ribosyltransferase-isomerase QueA [Accumulibacter sp.]